VLGQTITLNNYLFKIIGVLPQNFQGLTAGVRCDYYLPFSTQPQMCPNCPLTSDNTYWVQAMARLAPNADEAQIKSKLDVLFAQSIQDILTDNINNTAHIVMEDGRGGPVTARVTLAKPLWLLMGLAGLLLLVTCVNLTGLLLSRALKRRYETAVRAALGAGRGRLIRE
jgi:ABC-type antimicrobial peptide transport system permease subunit